MTPISSSPSKDPWAMGGLVSEGSVPLTPEEAAARLSANAVLLSDDNAGAYRALCKQAWFDELRDLSDRSGPLKQWVQAVECIASGMIDARATKTAIFWRSAFYNASKLAGSDTALQQDISRLQMQLSRFFPTRLSPQRTEAH